MNKIIFKFWIIHILAGFVLFIAYRFVIADAKQVKSNFFETVVQVLNIVLNLAYAFVYLVGIFISSLVIFLNRYAAIRRRFYASLFTFSGIPFFCVVYILVIGLPDGVLYRIPAVGNLLIFSVIYLLFSLAAFLFFRNRLKHAQGSHDTANGNAIE